MKILYVVASYYPHIGGVEYVVKSIAERLASKGHDVIVLAGESDAEKTVGEEINRVHVIRWPTWSPGNAYHLPRKRSELAKLLKEIARNLDVVHVHSVHSILSIFSLRVVGEMSEKPKIVLTPHYHGTGHTLPRRLMWFPWRVYLKRVIHNSVDVVHAVSQYESKLIRRHFGVEAVVIEHGVEEWLPQVPWRPMNYVMYSGRIEKYKNIDRLGNIVKILNREHGLNLELKIFGTGSYVKKLDKHLRKLGIEYEIKPPQPYKDYIEHLSRATLFALLSEKEAFGQSINEANAVGVPVVVAEPWGTIFSGRSRTLIVQLHKDDRTIAREIAEFLEKCRSQPKANVPTWSQVVDLYTHRLYC